MFTETTLQFIKKRAKSSDELKAIDQLVQSFERYKETVSSFKKYKPDYSGYRSSSSREEDYKFKSRSEATIKNLKQHLQSIQTHKSDSLVFYYILSNPSRSWDYYHGESQAFLQFEGSEWKRKYVKILFN